MTADQHEAAAPVGGAFYSLEDEHRLQQAKNVHRDTTASTERSARIALEARQTAAATLDSLQGQGNQLKRINRDVDDIGEDAKEAHSTLKDMECMRTWCCCLMLFSCCCDCDPHKERDATRRMRLREREVHRTAESGADAGMKARAQGQQGQLDPPTSQEMAEARRQELFYAGANGHARVGLRDGPRGDGLKGEDRDLIQRETEMQNRNLDIVGGAAADMKKMAQAMHAEVVAQDEDVTAAQDKMTGLHTEVRSAARQAYGYRRR